MNIGTTIIEKHYKIYRAYYRPNICYMCINITNIMIPIVIFKF